MDLPRRRDLRPRIQRGEAVAATPDEVPENSRKSQKASGELSTRQRALLDRVIQILAREPISVPSADMIAHELGIPHHAVDAILRLAIQHKEVLDIADGLFYTPAQIEALKSQITTWAAGNPFTANDLRDYLQTTRKYSQPLLDYLDSVGFTERQGTHRVIL